MSPGPSPTRGHGGKGNQTKASCQAVTSRQFAVYRGQGVRHSCAEETPPQDEPGTLSFMAPWHERQRQDRDWVQQKTMRVLRRSSSSQRTTPRIPHYGAVQINNRGSSVVNMSPHASLSSPDPYLCQVRAERKARRASLMNGLRISLSKYQGNS